MADDILDDNDVMITERYHYEFIHNVFGHFFHDLLEYFSTYLYPRFEWKVVGTYDKAVQWFYEQEQLGHAPDMPNRPALILNPSGEMYFDEAGHSAMQLWRFPNLAPGFVTRLYDPIYQDENLIVTPGFSRFKGEVEFLALVPSFYEYVDLKVFLLLIFGGRDRYIYPRFFNSFIILPQELIDYEYTREDGSKYKIDWQSHGATESLIKTVDKTKLVYPCRIRPRLRLTGMTDASTRLGGLERLPDWRLAWTVEYEIEVPSFLILKSDYLLEDIHFEVRYSSCFSENDLVTPPPEVREVWDSYWSAFDSTSGEVILPEQAKIKGRVTLQMKNRYFHLVSSSEAGSTGTLDLALPEQILDKSALLLYTKTGEQPYDFWSLKDNGWTLSINRERVPLQEGDILELYVYQPTT